MKKRAWISFLCVFVLACSFSATATATPTPKPATTSTPSTGWYDYETTEVIDESFWTPPDADISSSGYKLSSIDYAEISLNLDAQLVEKDGKLFLDDVGTLYYWPKDLNPNMVYDSELYEGINEDGVFQHARLSITIYYFNLGQFRVITKVSLVLTP